MAQKNFLAPLTSKRRVVPLASLATAAAAAAAGMIGLVTFPLLANVDGSRILLAIVVTAAPVAFPICLFLIRTISGLEVQRRDLHAREEQLTTAQRIAKLGYWQFDVETARFTLSDNVHDLLGDPNKTLNLNVPILLDMTHPGDRKNLQFALERIIREGGSGQIECRLTGLDGVERSFWVDGQRVLGRNGKPARLYGACQDITDRSAMEAALRESEDHYRHSVLLNPQIPWTADPDGNILEMGPRWTDLTGMTREDSLGSGWAAALHPDDVGTLSQNVSASLAECRPLDCEVRYRLTDGGYRWFRVRSAARRDAKGKVERWYGTTEDIHDRKTSDIALRQSEAFARSILDSSTDCVKVLALDGTLQFMNGPGRGIMEIDDYDFVHGKPWDTLWPEESRCEVRKALQTARAGGVARFAAFCPTAKGTPKWWDVSVSPIDGAAGQPARLLATSRDMTDHRHAQAERDQARRKAEDAARRLGAVLESTTDSVFILDREWRFTFLNARAAGMIAKGRNLVGEYMWDAFPDTLGTPFEECYRGAASRQEAVELEEFDPALGIWLQVCAYPSPDGLSVFFRDVTARHNAQEEIKRRMHEAKAASHAKSAFLATMSHEIRTPMHGVLGLTEQLSLTRMDVEQRNMLNELQASGSALLTVINDVLDYSKIEAGKASVEKRPSDLRATLKALEPIFRPGAEARQVGLSFVISDGLSSCHRTDAGRMRQVLTNLIGNALKFTERGAVSVEVTCGPVKDGQQAVAFAVTDSGIGITTEELTRIFEPFEQADTSTTRGFGGTGLGLTISKHLAQALGGELTAESAVGHGSTFTLSLDLEVVPEGEAAQRADAAEEVAPDVAGTRLLIAEDNRVNRIILSRLLNQAGCITTFAETGTAAVRSVESQDFDIVLMDISMPEMDGYEATRSIRSREEREGLPMLPIIALTAHVEKSRRDACIASGMQGMLSKPFRSSEILQAIADCSKSRRRDQAASIRTEMSM